jgi:hypothetical protein
MTLNPLGGHFGEGDGAAGFFAGVAFLAFFAGVAFFVGVGFFVTVVCGAAVALGDVLTVGEGEGDSVTAKLCVGRRESTSAVAKRKRFIYHSI